MRMTTGVYDLDNVGFTGVSVVTNAVSTTAFRGAGRPEAAVAIERMVDRFAAEIGMDPAEVRRRNLVPRFLDAVHDRHRHALRRGRLPRGARAGARARPATTSCGPSRRRRRAAGDPVALGIGLGVYVEITAGAPGTEFGAVELLDGGRLRVRTGATPYRPGPRDHVGDDRGRPHRRGHGPTSRWSTATPTWSARAGSPSAPGRCRSAGAAIANATAKLVDAGPRAGRRPARGGGRRRGARRHQRPLPRRRHAGPRRRLGRPGRPASTGRPAGRPRPTSTRR